MAGHLVIAGLAVAMAGILFAALRPLFKPADRIPWPDQPSDQSEYSEM
jgi:hypothetical protein